MFNVLNRFAIVLSVIVGFLFAYFLCGFESRPTEMFFEGGWVIFIIATAVARGTFLSKNFIESSLAGMGEFSKKPETARAGRKSEESEADSEEEYETTIESLSVSGTAPVAVAEASRLQARETVPSAPAEPEKPNWLVEFFSDRPLAKIGGTLLFLGAVFFLSLVWQEVGPVGKILIGLAFGFSLYGIGVWMDRRGHLVESRTLLGVGIAINALTILSGRWMIGGDDGYFSDTVTMGFLVLNTAFAVATALVYSSRTFLLFSFAFGYAIPFLVGATPRGPYGLLGYNAILTAAGYLLAGILSRRGEVSKSDASWLVNVVVGGSFVVGIINAFTVETTAQTAVFAGISVLLSVVGAVVDIRNFRGSKTAVIVAAGYASLFLLLTKTTSVAPIFVGIVPLFALSVFAIAAFAGGVLLSWTLFLPLVLGAAMLSVFGVHQFGAVIVPIFLLYGVASIFVLDRLSAWFRYAFFAFIGVFMIFSGALSNLSPVAMPDGQRLAIALAGISFFAFSSVTAIWKRLEFLVLLSNVMSAVLLAFVLVPEWGLSWAMFGIFVALALAVPFASVPLTRGTPSLALAVQKAVIALFAAGEIAYLGKDMWFSGSSGSMVTLGFVYLGVAAFSTVYSVALARLMANVPFSEFSRLPVSVKNGIYGVLAVPVSLFSLAVAVTFSQSPGVVSFVWILESAVLAFLYSKAKDTHLLAGSVVLLGIGLLKIVPFLDTLSFADYPALVTVALIAAALFAGAASVTKRDTGWATVYDVLHAIGAVAVAFALKDVVASDYETLAVSFLFLAASFAYGKERGFQGIAYVFATGVFTLVQYGVVEADKVSAAANLAALAVVVLSSWIYSKKREEGAIALTFALVMALFVTSAYVRVFSENVFAVTIYLALVASALLFAGISTNVAKYRTAGLYVGSYMLAKILFYDLWAGVDDLSVRVLALMVTGGLMIALSQLYGRSVKRGWSEEFSWKNFSNGITPKTSDEIPEGGEAEANPFTGPVAEELAGIDVSDVVGVRFTDLDGESFLLKRAGISRIAVKISQTFGKTEFRPGELSRVYSNAVPYVRSSLAKKDLDSVLAKLSLWISKGGSFEIIKK